MGTITGQEVVDRARRLLQDETPVRWSDAEVLDWINDGQRAVAIRKPNASSVTGNIATVAGAKQTLPSGALGLLDILRNTGGAAITIVDRAVLDAEDRSWYSATASNDAQHFVLNAADLLTYYLYPPRPSTAPAQVEAIYAVYPTNLNTLADTISLEDIYADALMDWLLHRAFAKDAEAPGYTERSQLHLQAFEAAVGAKSNAERTGGL